MQFKWTPQCQFSFEMLKDALMSAPILKYPDTEKPYTFLQMQVNMGGLVYSLRNTHL